MLCNADTIKPQHCIISILFNFSLFYWERIFGKFLIFGLIPIPLYRKGFAKTEKDEDSGSRKIIKLRLISYGKTRSVVSIKSLNT